MANIEITFMLTVPADMAAKAETIKKNLFRDRPYAEMYHHLIQIGMNEMQKKAVKEKHCQRETENVQSATKLENPKNRT